MRLSLKVILFALIIFCGVTNIYSQSGWISQRIGNDDFLSIHFPTGKDTGFIVSNYSTILKTTTGGFSWFSLNTGSTYIVSGFFTSSTLGAFWGIHPRLTTNGGNTWTLMSIYLNILGFGNIKAMAFLNNTTGYVIGGDFYPLPNPCCYDGIINKTTNAGLNWFEVYRHAAEIPQELVIRDSNHIIVLDHIALVSTTNGGINWTYDDRMFSDVRFFFASSMSNPFKDTIFIAGNIVGDTAAIIKSTDAGMSWNKSLLLPYHSGFKKIFFLNNNYGYAVGDTGLIVKTTNGGESWDVLNSGTRKRLNGVSFINKDTGFVVGDSGLVLTTLTGGLSGISQEYGNVPLDFTLHQNFPNPFNPTTTIVFEISKSHFVRLRVFDNNGKEIKTLISEYKTPGKYSIPFESDNLPSGVYFYKLEVNDFSETKRMVILK